MSKFGISQPVRRVEDVRFVTGKGRYTDDIDLPGQVYGYVLRSPVAHARIKSVDLADAKAAPGVVAIITGADLEEDGANALPCTIPLTNRDGTPRSDPKHPVLATDTVRYVGDNIAFILAESLNQAKDAAELIFVDYEELDVIADTARSLDAGVPQLHDDVPANIAFDWQHGKREGIEEAFAAADHVVSLDLTNNRIVVNSVETRGCVAEHNLEAGTTTLYTGTQGGWTLKNLLAKFTLKVDPDKVRIVTPDVGGGFGMKLFFYPEHAMCAWATRQIGRPVKWIGERSDAFLSDAQGRDHVTHAKIAFDADRKILGLKVNTIANLGAYYSTFAPLIPSMASVKVMTGVYDIPKLDYQVKGVFTNTVPVDAYRGAGRPEAIYMIERVMDRAAIELGMDPAELRRINMVPPSAMPYHNAAGEVYDTGEFERLMDTALERAGWADREARKSEARARGKRRGMGMCYYIEATAGNPTEGASIRFEEDGTVSLLVGTQSTGQGHETAFAQVLSDRLGIPFEQIRVVQGDTDRIKTGGGTGGSRSLTTEGAAILSASDIVENKGKHFAAHVLESAVVDIEFDAGQFRIMGTDRAIGIMELAARAREIDAMPMGAEGVDLSGGMDGEASHTVEAFTFPNGCHIVEIEIDEETAKLDILKYVVVDDFGKIVNPMLVEGQVLGGIGQGIGQALLENTVYDPDSGQLLSGSFMDYGMPRADDIPHAIDYQTIEVPCLHNPLGVKGCGEAGSIAAPPALINAVIDALSDLGVKQFDMPATPEKLWQAIHGAA